MPVIDVAQPEFMEDEEISIFSDAVGKFFEKQAPEKRVQKWREDGQVEREFWNEAGAAGLLGVSVPEEYGGHGGDFRHDMVIIDQQARHGVDGFAASLHNVIILPYIVRHGTEEQKKKWLPKMVTGELVTAIAMTEPGAGSDLQNITTTAIKDGNGYRLNGAKTFISNGPVGRISSLSLPRPIRTRGQRVSRSFASRPTVRKVSNAARSSTRSGRTRPTHPSCSLTMSLYLSENVLGGVEGRGFYQLMGELPQERLSIAIGSIIGIEKALETTVEYVKQRKAFGQTIWDFQNTQFTLADLKAKGTAARVFVNDCIKKLLDGELDVATASMAKYWVTELQSEVVDKCLQLHGGWGYINELPIARMYRDTRIARIYGGSNEIMKMLIARSM